MITKIKSICFSGLTTLALMSCFTAETSAQSTPIGERVKIGDTEQIGQQEQDLIFALELNTNQAEKFMAINQKYREVVNKLKSSKEFDSSYKVDLYKELRKEQNGEMKAIMTSDQYDNYLYLTQNTQNSNIHRGSNEGKKDTDPYDVKVGERVKIGDSEQIGEFEQDMIFALELNTNQAEKFMAVNEKYRDVLNKLKTSKDFNTSEKRELYKSLREEQNGEMKAFMSKEQYRQYLALSAEF